MTTSGLYTAGGTPGTYRVIATDSTGLADTAAVTVTGTLLGDGDSARHEHSGGGGRQPARHQLPAQGRRASAAAGQSEERQRFTGEPGTVVSGARELTNFTRSGSYWVIGGQTQQGQPSDASKCVAGQESCQWPEDLFLDDRLLSRVTSLGAVGPGKWYFDYGADKIYLAMTPPVTGSKPA